MDKGEYGKLCNELSVGCCCCKSFIKVVCKKCCLSCCRKGFKEKCSWFWPKGDKGKNEDENQHNIELAPVMNNPIVSNYTAYGTNNRSSARQPENFVASQQPNEINTHNLHINPPTLALGFQSTHLNNSNQSVLLPSNGGPVRTGLSNFDEMISAQRDALLVLSLQTDIKPTNSTNLENTFPLITEAKNIELPIFTKSKHLEIKATIKYKTLLDGMQAVIKS